jgi:hypothetical protein
MISRQDAINDALERLRGTGFRIKYGPIPVDVAAHGPMAAETISTLGQNDAVAPWVETYKAERLHLPMPPPKESLSGADEATWRSALGQFPRATDWILMFRQELEEGPWQEVLRTWIPRLVPGYYGGLTHGLIRTAYAVRALPGDAAPSSLELDELARGLAFWAAAYQTIPGEPKACDVPDIDAMISEHTAEFAEALLARPDAYPVPMIHCVTAATAMRNLLPHLPADFGPWAYSYVRQVSDALVARFGHHAPNRVEKDPNARELTVPSDDPAGRAIEHGDEHVIKLTEACLREEALRPNPVYRKVAEAVVHRLPQLRPSVRL